MVRTVAQNPGLSHEDQLESLKRLTHNVRTPLGLIVGYLELILLERAGPLSPKQIQYVNRMRLAADDISNQLARASAVMNEAANTSQA